MLRDIKQQASGFGAKLVMGLLIIAFTFWGVSGSILSAGNDEAATVNGDKISISDFNQGFQAQKNRMTSQFGGNIGDEFFNTENFKRGVLNQMIESELLRQQAQKFDFDVSDQAVKEYILNSNGLKVDGQFSKKVYANYLRQINKSADLLQREIRDDFKSSALPQMVSNSVFSLKSEINTQYKLNKQKRNFDFIEVSSKDFESKVEVSDDEINDHYKEFGSNYMTLEQVSVNYIELSVVELSKNIELTDDELQKYYENKKDQLLTSEKRKSQHILLQVDNNEEDVKSEMDKILQRITDGEDFAELAIELSQDPGSAKEGGDLGFVVKEDMDEAFSEKLFSMQVDEISEPVLSKFGYHIIKLTEIKSPEVPLYDDIVDTLKSDLKLEKAEEQFISLGDDLDTAVVDSDNVLEIAAESTGLELKSTELFARGRGAGVAANQEFMNIAFSDAIKFDNENSDIIQIKDGHIVYLHINEHNASVIKPLEDVTETILKKLTSEKASDLAKETATEFVTQINASEKTLQEVATELEKTIVEAKDIERIGSKQPVELVNNVFKLKLNSDKKEIILVNSSGNNFALVKLNSIVEADVATITEDESDNLAAQIERTVSNTEMLNITTYLKDNASVNINDRIFEEVQ